MAPLNNHSVSVILLSTLLFTAPAGAQFFDASTLAPEDQAELQTALEAVADRPNLAFMLPVAALDDQKTASEFSLISKDPTTNVAIAGYDPVGYFTDQKAMKGDTNYNAEYGDAVFLFASAEHRDMFVEEPARYLPAHGGYCSATLAQGSLTTADPVNWTVHGNRLFLTSTPTAQESLRQNISLSVESADKYWSQANDYIDQYRLDETAQPLFE